MKKFLLLIFILLLFSFKLKAIDVYTNAQMFTINSDSPNTYLSESLLDWKDNLSNLGWQNISSKVTTLNKNQVSYDFGIRVPVNDIIKLGLGWEYTDMGFVYFEAKGDYPTNQIIKIKEKDSINLNAFYLSVRTLFEKYFYVEMDLGYAFSNIDNQTDLIRLDNGNTINTESISGKAIGSCYWGRLMVGANYYFTKNIGINTSVGCQRLLIPQYIVTNVSESNGLSKFSIGDTVKSHGVDVSLDGSSPFVKAGVVFSFDVK